MSSNTTTKPRAHPGWLWLVCGFTLGCRAEALPGRSPAEQCTRSASFDVETHPQRTSSTVLATVDSGQPCTDIDQLLIVGRSDGRAPTSLLDPSLFVAAVVAPGELVEVEIPSLLPARDYGWALAACSEGACDFLPAPSPTATDEEVWYLPTIRNVSADGGRVIEENRIGCVDLFEYPEGFSLAGHLGIFYITTGQGYDDLRFVRSLEPGWQTWNGAGFTEPVSVARNALYESNWAELSCPWVVPTTNGESHWITMFLEIATLSEGDRYTQTGQLTSVNDIGDDFGIECTAESCTDCLNGQLCDFEDDSGDGHPGTLAYSREDYGDTVHSFGHGRIFRDEYNLESWNPATDDLTQLITMTLLPDCDAGNAAVADVFRGQRLAGEDSAWTLDETEDGCPAVAIADHHDPSVVYRGIEGAYKAYTLDSTWSALSVSYSEDEGRTWHDEHAVDIYYDNGSGEPQLEGAFDVRCMEDQDHLVWNDGGERRELMVFSARSHDVEYGCWPLERNGFVAAELWN